MIVTHCYIGIKKCGCVVAAVIDEGNKHTAESVAEFIEDGYTIERVKTEDARNRLMACKCPSLAAPPNAG